ncbi:hypothetical protein [Geobacillus thermodenitrificans]|uniref:hypothetical protein n=1 Tax=Geobacillus thermodenitrificans TaxID=33940 RepID=UPI003D1F0CB7
MENRLLVEVNKDFNFIYDKNKIETLEWDRVDITKESQGDEKRPDSIQYHIISLLKQKNYDIIFDDDSSGEAADIITIRVENEQIFIEFYHCKYSKKSVAGARVDDLYEVCGQAQKSIQWKENPKKLIEHMIYRERSKYSSKNVSRFEIGDNKKLVSIKRMLNYYKCHLHIFIVQPGVSKAKITDDQLQLLAATENYLMETYKIKFTPIFSK